MKKIVLIIIFILSAGLVFSESVTPTAVSSSDFKFNLRYRVDLYQSGLSSKINDLYYGYVQAYGGGESFTGFIEGTAIWDKLELKLSLRRGIKYDNTWYLDERGVFHGVSDSTSDRLIFDYWPNIYLKYSIYDWYVAIGLMNLDSSEARFFTLPDIFYIEKRFDFLDELRRGYIYPTIESLNLGYKANILSFDFRILDLRGMFSNYLSEYIGLYGKAQVVFSSFKLAIYGSYRTKTYNSSDNLINTNFLGVNVSLTPNNLFSIYLETRTKDIVSWPIYLETVLGVRLIETDGYSATLENYYSTGDIYKVFIEGEKKNVFGWDSWDANVAFLYSPSEFNNFKTFFTMRKNWSKNWLSEFRYGYESIGNHIIDVSIRLYDM